MMFDKIQLFAGILLILLGLISVIFKSSVSKILYSNVFLNRYEKVEDDYGKENSIKITLFSGIILIIAGITLLTLYKFNIILS